MLDLKLASRRKLSRAVAIGGFTALLLLWVRKLQSRPLTQCPHSSFAASVVIMVKTGATEASDRLPGLMKTSLRCAENVVFFSDLEQDIGPYHLQDALENVSPEVMQQSSEFEFYRQQQDIWRRHGNISSLKGMRDANSPEEFAAWKLDKYKNLHILERTWDFLPDRNWYILIDLDTYIVWDNLLRWLPSLDSSRKAFFGSKIFLSDIAFPHGGSGIILSRSTMYDLAVSHNGTAARWDPEIHKDCCGDFVLGKALTEYGNILGSIRPQMSGEKVATIPFFREYWCQPVFTMHYLKLSEMEDFDNFERSREDKSAPITHAEIFAKLVKEPLLAMPPTREDWDNLSWKMEMGSGLSGGEDENFKTESFEVCGAACEANTDCFQYQHDGEICFIGKAIRLGEQKFMGDDKRWQSGWHQDRVRGWISQQEACGTVEFPNWEEHI